MTTTKVKYQIPFDENGNMMSYDYSYGHKQITWKDVYIFNAGMQYDGYGRGRSAATIYMKDVTTGKRYPMFLSTFDELMRTPGRFAINNATGNLIFTGNWTFCKKGQNYAMMPSK
jgi:hypothetical protein